MMLRLGLLAQAPGAPLTSSAWIRLKLPLQHLEEQGQCELVQLEAPGDASGWVATLAGLDRLIVQRAACPCSAVAEALVRTCHGQRLPLVFDLDDALFALPGDHPEWQRYSSVIPALDHLLAQADWRVTSTAVLAEQCRQRLRAQGLIPGGESVLLNCLDPKLWAGPERFPRADADGPLRLIYMGSRTHDADLALILPELDALAEEEPNAFRLTLVGGVSQRLRPRPWLNILEVPPHARRYPRFVRWLMRHRRQDLGLAPLATHTFNAAKSDVKLLDYAALGIPALCSPGPAYQHLLQAGLALEAQPGEWANRIRWAKRHRRRLRRLAQAAHAHLWRYRSNEQLAGEWFELLWAIKPKRSNIQDELNIQH
jgi:O-antigen biosynthesis protein